MASDSLLLGVCSPAPKSEQYLGGHTVFRNTACAPFARASVVAVLGGTALLLWSSALLAAEDKKDGTKKDDDLELSEVQVTGTRIQLPNVTSANPITTVTAEEMQRLGIVNVADALTTLVPQNISSYMPTLVGDDQAGFGGAGQETMNRGSFFIGNTIANLRGLDPTFGTRTLTLIDGRRVNSTSNQADVVDLNIIPSNLLERVDVVTGGASATYGSGAMAGVVNLVLNRRLTGINLDMDYGINEAGDGASPHVSLSGGMPLFGGKGHALIGLEWQDQHAVNNCAAARDWCAESRAMQNNYTGFLANATDTFSPLPGFEGYPARFEMANVRRSQWSQNSTLYFNNANVTTDLRFNDAGTDLEPYALGFRGGTNPQNSTNAANAINGDGPLATWGSTMRAPTNRKTMFTNFEYDITPRTTAYVQARYAETKSTNVNAFSTGNYCVRFDSQGVAAQLGATAHSGDVIASGSTTWPGVPVVDGLAFQQSGAQIAVAQFTVPNNSPLLNGSFRAWLGWSGGTMNSPAGVFQAPYWVSGGSTGNWGTPVGSSAPVDFTHPPKYTFANAVVTDADWVLVRNNPAVPTGQYWWILKSIHLTADFEDPGVSATLPEMGRNSYAFLNNLSPDALAQLQRAFGVNGNFGAIIDPSTSALMTGANTTTTGGSFGAGGGVATGLDVLYGTAPCNGFTAVRKVWNPQVQQYTTQNQKPWSATAGVRGRFGGDWRWEGSMQYGKTNSRSVLHNTQTNLRMALATDAVVDDRPTVNGQANPTYGQPVCRVVRDGVPTVDYVGRPVTQVEDLQAIAAGCKPLNVFGSTFAQSASLGGSGAYTYDAAALQQAALDYAFVDSVSAGWNDSANFNFNASGTLWEGFGAGPLTGAIGVEVDQNRTENTGTQGTATFYERADLAGVWADAFGGKTRSEDVYTELNLPIISGLEGLNLFSVNLGGRYTSYYNKGGAGTTGQHSTQDVVEWKFQTVFEPFEWVRFRASRSRDQRAAGYRDLFLQQQSLPDQFSGSNPWREWNPFSTEARQERWTQVRTGNPDLNPEKSDTLTIGMVLSPGGWAQGMRLSIDYNDIRVKDAIYTPFVASTTAVIQSCWTGSGNQDGSTSNPDQQVINGNINYDFYDTNLQVFPCREIHFATNDDGSVNLQDIISYNSSRPRNALPYQSRGIDVSLNYNFPLSRMFENLPGSMSLTVRGTRALEASGVRVNSQANGVAAISAAQCTALGGTRDSNTNCLIPVDLVGQIRSSVFIPGVAAQPKWQGNFSAAYLVGNLTTTLSARYIGAAVLDKSWCDAEEAAAGCLGYQDAGGQYLAGSVDNNQVKPYFNFALNGSYNLKVGNMRQFQVFGSINNLLDKSPPFTGGGLSGASSQYHDTMGRAYRFGVRLKF
jgi:outer membrane receptor protein involved in Fe transport